MEIEFVNVFSPFPIIKVVNSGPAAAGGVAEEPLLEGQVQDENTCVDEETQSATLWCIQ